MVFFLTACAGGKDALSVTAMAVPPTVTATATFTPAPTPVPTKNIPSVLITSGDWAKPVIALTFDVCQDPDYPAGYDAALVAVLEQYNIPTTFFMGGDWMRTHPDETKALAANPNFELGNHSWSHPDFTKLSQEEMAQQIEMTEQILFELTGRHSHFFRPPYGYYNDMTLQVAAEHGLYTVEWDSVSGDPDPNFDAATILAEVQRTVRNGSIVIMHANGRGWHTAEALPSVIESLQSRGFTFATLSQLLEIK